MPKSKLKLKLTKPKLRLWKLERKEGAWADELEACIVRAPNESEARKLASQHAVDEGAAMWLDAEQVTCKAVAQDGEAEAILLAMRAV